MKLLNLQGAFTVLKLTHDTSSRLPLSEQVRALMLQAPYMILDVEGIPFNSMLVGEIVNIYQAFSSHWGDRKHRLMLIHVADASKAVFASLKLTDKIPIYDTADEAMSAHHSPAVSITTA